MTRWLGRAGALFTICLPLAAGCTPAPPAWPDGAAVHAEAQPTSLALTWPAATGKGPIRYTVTAGGTPHPVTEPAFSLTGLSRWQDVTVSVTAANAGGTTPAALTTTARTLDDQPPQVVTSPALVDHHPPAVAGTPAARDPSDQVALRWPTIEDDAPLGEVRVFIDDERVATLAAPAQGTDEKTPRVVDTTGHEAAWANTNAKLSAEVCDAAGNCTRAVLTDQRERTRRFKVLGTLGAEGACSPCSAPKARAGAKSRMCSAVAGWALTLVMSCPA